MVIDDEAVVRLALADLLEEAGHTPVLARQGAQLRDDLQFQNYDVVLTDLSMPQFTGWDVVDWLKTNRPHVPVIALSGRIDKDLDPAWYKVFAALLTKPVNDGELIRTVARVAPG
jgi:CheY-like chemotaxis protein